MVFNVSAAYTQSFNDPDQALNFDYAWEPDFSRNLNQQELARKTAQMNLGKQKLAELGRLKSVREEYDKIFEQKKWEWNETLKEAKAQRRRDNLGNIIDAGADWIGNKNENIVAALGTMKAQRNALDDNTGQGNGIATAVIRKRLIDANIPPKEADELLKSYQLQLPGLYL